jgi:hypothetical protein
MFLHLFFTGPTYFCTILMFFFVLLSTINLVPPVFYTVGFLLMDDPYFYQPLYNISVQYLVTDLNSRDGLQTCWTKSGQL